jgi:hypothetical protein
MLCALIWESKIHIEMTAINAYILNLYNKFYIAVQSIFPYDQMCKKKANSSTENKDITLIFIVNMQMYYFEWYSGVREDANALTQSCFIYICYINSQDKSKHHKTIYYINWTFWHFEVTLSDNCILFYHKSSVLTLLFV